MNQEINLRRAKVEDVDDILKVEKSVDGIKVYSALTDRNEAVEDIKNNFVYLMEKNGKIVGNISYDLKSKTHAYLDGLAVMPQFQRRGIARAAVKKVLDILKGVKLIDLVTHPENKKSIGLYTSLGFKKIGKQKENYFGDGQPRIRMVLKR